MFKKIEPLEYSKHQDLRLSKQTSFEFARNLSSIKLSLSELRQASRFYPIVFMDQAPGIPQALLAIEPGKNLFVDGKGNWKAGYVPAFLRFYPFTLAKISDKEEQFVLCLDPEADHFKSGMGDPLFNLEGKPVELIQTVVKSLAQYQKELAAVQALFKQLDEKDIIVPKTFKVMAREQEKVINGFKGVDMKKILDLDDGALAGMVKNGTMGMVHEHVHSLSCFSKLVSLAHL